MKMHILDLALKDIQQLMRDRRTFFFFLAMPIVFTVLFGFLFSGGSDENDPRLPLGFVKLDAGLLADGLEAELAKSDVFRLVVDEEASLEQLRQNVAEDELAGVLVVPADYGASLRQGDVPRLPLIITSNTTTGVSLKQGLVPVAMRLHSAALTAQLSVEAYESQGAFADEAEKAAYFDQAFEMTLAAWETPPIQINRTATGQVPAEEGEALDENPFIHSSPGMMMQFAIAGLLGAAEIIVNERKSYSLQRLLTTSISRVEILLGHYLAMFFTIFTQIIILMVFGQLFLGLNYFGTAAGLIMAVTISMCFAALGLLIGALAKSPENAVVFSLIPMFILSGLGGAWVPLEFTSETVQFIGHFSPVAWGMDGIKNILGRGMGLEAAWLPAGMLLLFTAVFFGLAAWRFKFE
jgi:ABC-2 type transport system permease protein